MEKKNLNKKPQNGLGGGGMSAVQELRRLTQEDAVNSTLVWSIRIASARPARATKQEPHSETSRTKDPPADISRIYM